MEWEDTIAGQAVEMEAAKGAPPVYLSEGWFREFQTNVYDHEKARPMTAVQYSLIERQPRPIVTRTGEPSEEWPEGAYLNQRTGEVILCGQQDVRSFVARGYFGSTETEALPDDTWFQVGPGEHPAWPVPQVS